MRVTEIIWSSDIALPLATALSSIDEVVIKCYPNSTLYQVATPSAIKKSNRFENWTYRVRQIDVEPVRDGYFKIKAT